MQSLIGSLKKFDEYLRGGRLQALQDHMHYYDNHPVELNRNFYLIQIDDDAIKKDIESLLTNLIIPKKQWERYFSCGLSVHDFLVELTKEGHIQLHYIIELIDNKTKATRRSLLFYVVSGILIIAFVFGLLFFSRAGIVTQRWGGSTHCFLILGLFLTIGISLYHLYTNQFDKKRPLFDRLRDHFFIFTSMVMNIIAYGLWLNTTVSMTLRVATWFVAASSMAVVKELVYLSQELMQYRRNFPVCDQKNLNHFRAETRHKFRYQKHRNGALINLAAAIILMGIMAAWCFIPTSLMITISAITAITLVYSVRYFLLQKNARIMSERLQDMLRRIENSREP